MNAVARILKSETLGIGLTLVTFLFLGAIVLSGS